MGNVRRCVRYSKGKAGLRCAEFKERTTAGETKSPACDPRLKGGGRSPGLIRQQVCAKGAVPKAAPRKAPKKKPAKKVDRKR